MSYQARVTRLMNKYDAPKLSDVLKMLAKKPGREEDILAALVKKYGPEPEVSTCNNIDSTVGTDMSYKARVTRLMNKYDAPKLSDVLKMLAKKPGREEDILAALVKKYGPEPEVNTCNNIDSTVGTDMSYQARVTRLMNKYDASKLSDVLKMLAKKPGREEDILAALVKKHGPEPEVNTCNNIDSTVGTDMSYKARVTRLMNKYDVSKLSDVLKMLAKKPGREEDILAALVKKYGPEPEVSTCNNIDSTVGTDMSYKAKVTRLMNKYDASKLSDVLKMLAKKPGREEDILAALVKKYGPEPEVNTCNNIDSTVGTDMSYQARVTRLMNKYDAPKLSDVLKMLAKKPGREEDILAALVKKYGPEPEVSTCNNIDSTVGTDMSYKARVTRLMNKYDAPKLSDVLKMLAKKPGREEDILAALVKKYGPEPEVNTCNNIDSTVGTDMSYKARVTRLMNKYDVSKLSDVLKMLAKKPGREEDILAALVKKYGPEPEVSTCNNIDSTVGTDMSYKAKVTRLMNKYDASKLSDVLKMLAKKPGREEDILAALVKKYGPEPEVSTCNNIDSTVGTDMSYQARVTRLMNKYDASKLSDVLKMLAKKPGREEDILAALVKKHGPEPEVSTCNNIDSTVGTDMSYKARVTRLMNKYDVSKLSDVLKMLAKKPGREEDILAALVKKHGPEPEVSTCNNIDSTVGTGYSFKIKQLLLKHNDKVRLSQIDTLLSDYEGKEEQLCSKLTAFYKLRTMLSSTFDYELYILTHYGMSPDINSRMTAFGAEFTTLAAALIVVAYTIGTDTLYDLSTPFIQFPSNYPKVIEPCDDLAFRYLSQLRDVYIASYMQRSILNMEWLEYYTYLKNKEAELRDNIKYKMFIAYHSFAVIVPFEEKIREKIIQLEQLNFNHIKSSFSNELDYIRQHNTTFEQKFIAAKLRADELKELNYSMRTKNSKIAKDFENWSRLAATHRDPMPYRVQPIVEPIIPNIASNLSMYKTNANTRKLPPYKPIQHPKWNYTGKDKDFAVTPNIISKPNKFTDRTRIYTKHKDTSLSNYSIHLHLTLKNKLPKQGQFSNPCLHIK